MGGKVRSCTVFVPVWGEKVTFLCCIPSGKAYNVRRTIMAPRSLHDMMRRPARRTGGEARDGVMFFVLPPLLLALVFGICAMASHPAEDAPAPAEPEPVAAAEPAVPAVPAPAVEEKPAAEKEPAAPAAEAEEDFADEAEEEPLSDEFEEGEDAPAEEEQI